MSEPVPDELDALADEAVSLAQRWAAASDNTATRSERRASERLAHLVRDRAGVEFALHFIDRVVRPEDPAVAARELARLVHDRELPGFLGPVDRALLAGGALTASRLPQVVVPLATRRVRQLVGHLVQDADGRALTQRLTDAKESGLQLNLNLLGEAVLGDEEANRRFQGTLALLERPDVDYVSIKASSVVAQLHPWDLEGGRERLIERLLPLYRRALAHRPQTFVNLDMEEYKDLELTLETFEGLMSRPDLADLPAGIVLQAYLPDALPALERLVAFAEQRHRRGGAPIKIRLVKGANLSMERVDAELHGWPQAPYLSKEETDANYVRLLDVALRPGTSAVRIGVASHNLFTVALALLLARARGVADRVDVEMLQGMAPAQMRAVQADVGRIVLYTPVVASEDFDVAVSYLVRRLEENAAPENFLHELFDGELEGQERRFRQAIAERAHVAVGPRRTQDRSVERGRSVAGDEFGNEPDTDPSLAANRRWATAALRRDPGPLHGQIRTDPDAVDARIAAALAAAPRWAATPAHERARLLRAAADALERCRGELLTVMAHEAGKTVAEADPEVSEAIDFAAYYADRAGELAAQPGVLFTPHRLVVATPPWNFPIAIPLGGPLAALAAGSTAILKAAPQTRRCAEIGVAALHEAGIPPDVLQIVHTDEGEAGRRLVTSPDVDAVILTGASDTASMFRSWRPDLRLFAETSGKNALVVTPSADVDLAVADILHSAFSHAGQKCSAASLVITVGSMARSRRFRRQLIDGVRTLRCGPATDAATVVGPLIEPPTDKLRRALTTLEPGEQWLVQPRQLDDEGRLWTPGLRAGVRPGSFLHQTEVFGPVLAMMEAADLDEALEWQNAVGYGLTGGLHSLDDDEIDHWLEHVEVGNTYVNRHITGAIVQRQSFGGWKASVVGPGAKTGGPNYVAQLGTWADGDLDALPSAEVGDRARAVLDLGEELDDADHRWLLAAAGSDAAAWSDEFAQPRDRTGLRVQANVFRYRRLPRLDVRVAADARRRDVLRVVLAAAAAEVPLVVSGAPDANELVSGLGALPDVELRAESDDEFAAQVAQWSDGRRLRALGPLPVSARTAAAATGTSVLDAVPVCAGRRELLPLLREQTISRTLHRFGYIPDSR